MAEDDGHDGTLLRLHGEKPEEMTFFKQAKMAPWWSGAGDETSHGTRQFRLAGDSAGKEVTSSILRSRSRMGRSIDRPKKGSDYGSSLHQPMKYKQ